MEKPKPRVYWESSPFCAAIWNELDRGHICHTILQSAKSGDIELFTSTLTLVEVFKVPQTADELAAEGVISSFFRNKWIRKQVLDWYVAQEARRLQRQFPHLDGRDAIHLATAIYLEVDFLHTYDEDDLIKCNGKIPNLTITKPEPFGPIPMDFGNIDDSYLS